LVAAHISKVNCDEIARDHRRSVIRPTGRPTKVAFLISGRKKGPYSVGLYLQTSWTAIGYVNSQPKKLAQERAKWSRWKHENENLV